MADNTDGGKKKFELLDHDVQKTIKHGGGHLMVWATMTYDGVGPIVGIEGILDAEFYREILEETLVPSLAIRNINIEEIFFQHDNDPKHTAKLTKRWFEENQIKLLQWPAQSPDLNPIENLWKELKRLITLLKELPKSENDLWEKVRLVWLGLEREYCAKLVQTMPRRISSVLKAKGGYTKW